MTTLAIVFGTLLAGCAVAGALVFLRLSEQRAAAERRLAQASQTLTRWVALLQVNVPAAQPELHLAELVAQRSLEEFGAAGTLVLGPVSQEEAQEVPVWAADGLCRAWAQRAPEAPGLPRLRLAQELPHSFYWHQTPQIFADDRVQAWLPADAGEACHALLVAPLALGAHRRGLVLLVRTREQPPFERADQELMQTLMHLVQARYAHLELAARIAELEQQVHEAHQEGMVQIASGIIHNIGNAVTVVQLGLERLSGRSLSPCLDLLGFQQRELLPILAQRLREGTLEQYLRDTPEGHSYLNSLREVSEQLAQRLEASRAEALALVAKFEDITHVIALQQRFIGELGTENIVTLEPVLEDVARASRPVLEQRHVELELVHESQSRVLVDPAMLQHVLLLLIKYALESIAAAQLSQGVIRLASSDQASDGREWVVIELSDGGCETPDGDTPTAVLRRGTVTQKARDLQFCRNWVAKYGGSFTVRLDRGTVVQLRLPVYRANHG
jgi:hypothetical protein